MIPYLGCETAREMLEAFADGELTVADQVAVEAHLRWCRTCAARVEDLCLIGAGIRSGSPLLTTNADEDADALAAVQSEVLTRIMTEHDQSFRERVRESFQDMHLLWPALGATIAVLICLLGVFGVLTLTTREQPDSLAAMIESIAEPGSDGNPVRPGPTFSLPRSLNDPVEFDRVGLDNTVFAVATVVTREGRIAGYELLDSHPMTEDVQALLHAVKQSRFEPAQTAGGRTVAMNMVWLFAWTTVERDVQLEELLSGTLTRPRRRAETPVPAVNTEPPAAVPDKPVTEVPATSERSPGHLQSATA